MGLITWDTPGERYFQYGVDRGVLYVPSLNPVPWNGLIGLEETGVGQSNITYRDGKVILADVEASEFAATITAYFYPDQLSACLGITEAAENLYLDNQKPKRFGMTYRTLIGSGYSGDRFGYQIHLIYNCMAALGTRSRKTLSDNVDPVNFTFDVVCTPIKLTGYRPTAHYILDTRDMNPGQLLELENLLYGTGVTQGRMPTPTELFDLMNFGVTMKVHNEGGNVVSIKGASQYFTTTDGGMHYTVTNMNSTVSGNDNVISDGGNTVIVP